MRELSRVAVAATALLVALASAGATARADGPPGPGDSPCAAPGMATVPMLGDTVVLGLPLQLDGNRHLELRDAVVCVHAAVGATEVADEAVVVPAPDDQGAGISQGAPCNGDPGATVVVQCAPVLQPTVALQRPDQGANQLGMDVVLPLGVCVAGNCASATREVAAGAVVGMLECAPPPEQDDGTPSAGAVCVWHGVELDVDGVALDPAPALAAGAWLTPHASYDIAAAPPGDPCVDPQNPGGCPPPQPGSLYAVAQDTGGEVLLLVLPNGQVPVVETMQVQTCVAYSTAGGCPSGQ